jgi:hypothetical protein
MKTKSAIKYLLVFFFFLGMSCTETVIDPAFIIGKESTFRMNELYTSSDGQYTLQIKEIGDSRCPEGVVCVWAGEVTVKGEWTDNKNKSTFEVHSVETQMNKVPEGFTIKIVDAKPYPKYGVDNRSEDLAVTLLIQKK